MSDILRDNEIEVPVVRPDAKILVVDDREDNLLSIETILEREGYTIVKANSGTAALKLLLKEHDFSLILMDVQMPNLNGLETATLIYEREKLRHIPIIFITAHQYGEDLVFKGYKMGGVDYISKPVDPHLLRLKVSVFVDLYRKNHQLLEQEKELKQINESLKVEIEERKASEQKVLLLNKQLVSNNETLQKTNEELDRFAYVASHDLQEPLRKIILFTERLSMLIQSATEKPVDEHLQKITGASKRMQTLIEDLLHYSRHAQMAEDFIETDLNTIIKEVISDLEFNIQKKKAVINVKDLPVLYVIPAQARQLFQNLISNSLKFSTGNSVPQIEIFGEEITGNNNNDSVYHIHVKDNGIGFDEKYADDIFVVFKRLHSYHEIEGTGIGLSICKKIAEKHSGSIAAKGKPNEGSVFTVTLPKYQLVK